MIEERWVLALVAVGAGLVLGAVAGAIVRRSLSRESRREAMQEIAGPASIFVFWLATSAGVVAAMAMTNPETLEPIPSDILRWLPNVLAAGLILLVGYALRPRRLRRSRSGLAATQPQINCRFAWEAVLWRAAVDRLFAQLDEAWNLMGPKNSGKTSHCKNR